MKVPFVTKSKKTPAQKEAERKKAEDDPMNYKRRDPPMYNPFNHLALLKSYYTPSNTQSYKQVREILTRGRHGIPTTASLEKLREGFNAGVLSEAEKQFRYSTPRPVRNGYEFQILKA